MFCIYGFGAKTHSGFGLAQDNVQEMALELRSARILRFAHKFLSFKQMLESIDEVAQNLNS